MRGALATSIAGLLLLAAAGTAAAQQSSVTMVAEPAQVEVGGMLRLTVRAEIVGDATSQVTLPDLRAFEVVQRQVSRPFTLRMGTHVQGTEMHSLLLRARTAGAHTLAPAWVQIAGRRYESQPLTIQVGPPPAGTRADAPPGARSTATSGDGMSFDADAFLRTWIDDAEPYVGQQVTVTLYLYARSPLRGSPAITQEATTDGLWVQDLDDRNQPLTAERRVFNRQEFYVYPLRRFAAFPLRAGEVSVGAATLEVTQQSIFDVLGGGGGTPQWNRTGVPVTMRVRALPTEGRPPGGEPHVGALALTAELDRAQVQTGDAVTLTLTATGRGAIDQLRLPSARGAGLRILQPEIRDQVTSPGGVVGGTRMARWLIVPERPGTFSLGPFEVPVFDPATQRYSVARAEAITLLAAGNAPDAPADAEPAPGVTRPDRPSPVSSDSARFGPVRTHAALARSQASWTSSPTFLALFLMGPLAVLLALGVRGARARALRVDPSKAPKRAQKAARQRLGGAERHASAGAPRDFYAAVALALKEVLEAKLARPVGSLTHPELREVLSERGLAPDVAEGLVDELEGCDFARFSAVGVSAEEMQRCLDRTRALLAKLDRFTPRPAEEA